jgi:hypothetical protein
LNGRAAPVSRLVARARARKPSARGCSVSDSSRWSATSARQFVWSTESGLRQRAGGISPSPELVSSLGRSSSSPPLGRRPEHEALQEHFGQDPDHGTLSAERPVASASEVSAGGGASLDPGTGGRPAAGGGPASELVQAGRWLVGYRS